MQYNNVHYIAPKECPFTWKGENLAELRRVKLVRIATALKVDATGSKNEILGRLVNYLKATEAESELSKQ